MRRSLLFVPGNNPAMLQNSDVFGSDAVIFDLEDAVSLSEKDSARMLVAQYLEASDSSNLEIVVRINGLDTDCYMQDLQAVVSDKIDTIMLPKAQLNDLLQLDQILTAIEHNTKMTKKIAVIPIIELAVSVLQVDDIAKCARVNGVLLGAEDLSSDLQIVRTRQGSEIMYPRMRIAYACAAYKIDAIDTPFTDTNDEQGLQDDCINSNNIGFNSKSAIHPNQVAIINKVYVPTMQSIQWALRVEEANKQASAKNLGVFSLDGKMVDKPIIERANKILAKARRYNLL